MILARSCSTGYVNHAETFFLTQDRLIKTFRYWIVNLNCTKLKIILINILICQKYQGYYVSEYIISIECSHNIKNCYMIFSKYYNNLF